MPHTIALVGDVYRILASGNETGGSYCLMEATVFAGGGPPPHIHSREEEGFYVLEGAVTFYVGEERMVGMPGDSFHIPRGTVHRFKNETDRPARMLVWVTPSGIEEMFLRVGHEVDNPTIPPKILPDEIERLLAIAPEYGIDIPK